jgi:hypothetical protein
MHCADNYRQTDGCAANEVSDSGATGRPNLRDRSAPAFVFANLIRKSYIRTAAMAVSYTAVRWFFLYLH